MVKVVSGGVGGGAPSAGNERRAARSRLGDRIAEHAFHLDAAMHRLLADIRAFDEARYWADEGAASCAAWLSWRIGWTPSAGREHVRVANALAGLPLIDGALREGRLSYSKVRAITRVATPATEAALLHDALFTTAAQLEIVCRKFATVRRLAALSPEDVRARRAVARRERADGMVVIEAVLPADEAALVMAAIDRAATRVAGDVAAPEDPTVNVAAVGATAGVAAMEGTGVDGVADATAADGATVTVDNATAGAVVSGATAVAVLAARRLDRADGLVAMSQAVLRGDAPGRAPVEVVLTVAREVLSSPPAAPAPTTVDQPMAPPADVSPIGVGVLADGTCVSAETARRLACDCGLVELHEDDRGQPLSVGRRRRTIPPALARALARRDPTCRFPGCTSRSFLDGHHVVHWAHGGETSLTNTLRLCTRHHRFVHEHGYRIEWQDGAPAFFDGQRRVLAEPPRAVTEPLGWATIRANSRVTIDATSGASRWDGEAVQYEWVVDRLAYAELRRPAG